jgi:hypothetical protein
MDVTDPSFPDRNRPKSPAIDPPTEPAISLSAEPVDDTRRLGLIRSALIRFRHRHLTNRELWNTRVDFDLLVAANSWDLARNVDELNERYPS